MSKENAAAVGSDPLAVIDLRIVLARKRLARLEAERDRELTRQINRLLQKGDMNNVGDRLVDRLDQLIAIAKRKLVALEDERAAALLASIDALLEREA